MLESDVLITGGSNPMDINLDYIPFLHTTSYTIPKIFKK